MNNPHPTQVEPLIANAAEKPRDTSAPLRPAAGFSRSIHLFTALAFAPYTFAAEPTGRFTVQPCILSWPATAGHTISRQSSILLDTTTGETWFLITREDKAEQTATPSWFKVPHSVSETEMPITCLPAPLRGNYKYFPAAPSKSRKALLDPFGLDPNNPLRTDTNGFEIVEPAAKPTAR